MYIYIYTCSLYPYIYKDIHIHIHTYIYIQILFTYICERMQEAAPEWVQGWGFRVPSSRYFIGESFDFDLRCGLEDFV